MNRLYLVVGNPTARSGRAEGYLARAVEGLRRRGQRAELLSTQPAGGTVSAVREAIERLAPDVVVCLGGDGTFNEVARGILASPSRPPLGLLPMGTANDQGRSLGVCPGPAAIEENLDIVMAGHLRELDAGECELVADSGEVTARTLFFDSIGWGMQPEILARRNEARARARRIPVLRELTHGRAVFVGATIERFLASLREPRAMGAVVVSGERTVEYRGLTDLIVSNTAVHAGDWVLDRFSEPDDGLFELVPMRGGLDWASKAVRDYAKLPLFQEDLDKLGITHSQGLTGASFDVRLTGREAIPSQIDGDEWLPGNHFRVTVHEHALPVITPAGFRPPWRFNREPRARAAEVTGPGSSAGGA